MSTRIEICDRALTRIGVDPLQSEGADGADVVLQVYDDLLALIVSMRPWTFARRTQQLTRKTDAPESGWYDYQFQLPPDRVGPPRTVWKEKRGDPFTEYELREDVLLTNAETIYARFRIRPEVVNWPPMFRECVVNAVAGQLALTLNEDAKRRRELFLEVFGDPETPGLGGLIAIAANDDSQSSPSQILMPLGGPLLAARRGG